jgi:DNA-binding transcriptional ArsR family regulator
MKDPLQPQRCAELLVVLAAPERLRIIRFLRDGARNVTKIVAMLRTTHVNVAHHLRVLKEAGVIRARKKGRFVYYSLSPAMSDMEQRDADGKQVVNLGCCKLELPTEEVSR